MLWDKNARTFWGPIAIDFIALEYLNDDRVVLRVMDMAGIVPSRFRSNEYIADIKNIIIALKTFVIYRRILAN